MRAAPERRPRRADHGWLSSNAPRGCITHSVGLHTAQPAVARTSYAMTVLHSTAELIVPATAIRLRMALGGTLGTAIRLRMAAGEHRLGRLRWELCISWACPHAGEAVHEWELMMSSRRCDHS